MKNKRIDSQKKSFIDGIGVEGVGVWVIVEKVCLEMVKRCVRHERTCLFLEKKQPFILEKLDLVEAKIEKDKQSKWK